MARQKDLYKRNEKGLMRKAFTYNGKRYYIAAKTNEELIQKELEKRKQLEEEQTNKFNPVLNDYYVAFTEDRRTTKSGCTLRAQRFQFELLAGVELPEHQKTFGELRIKDIKRDDVIKVRQILLKQGKTPEHLNICVKHLKHVFNVALIDDIITKNPCFGIDNLKKSTVPVTETKHRALTKEETAKFFKAAEDRQSYYINVFRLMIGSGMRMGEVAALYLTDVDKKKKVLHIRRTLTRDEVGGYVVGDTTKTPKGVRDIPLFLDDCNLFEIIKMQDELQKELFGDQVEGVLFKSSDGELLREYTLNREIKRICKVAGIEKFTSHAFRDTFATRFLEKHPGEVAALSKILGHSKKSITLDIYVHEDEDHIMNLVGGNRAITG